MSTQPDQSVDDLNALRRDLTSCRAELAAIGIMLQERSALPDPGGPNFALVAGAVLKYILTLEGRIHPESGDA